MMDLRDIEIASLRAENKALVAERSKAVEETATTRCAFRLMRRDKERLQVTVDELLAENAGLRKQLTAHKH